MRHDYSILTIYEHALKPHTKLSHHIAKHRQYRQYCATVLNAHFEQVSIKIKIANILCTTDYSYPKFSPNSKERNLKQRREMPP